MPRRRARREVVLLLAAAVHAPRVHAQSNEERAEALFREGQARLRAGDTHEACELLSQSQRIDPALGTLLNLAVCHERADRIGSAYHEYVLAAKQAHDQNEPERERFARERASELERRIPRMRIDVADAPQDLSIQLDGRSLDPSDYAAEIRTDPGQHRIDVTASGKKPWRRDDIRAEPQNVTVVHVVLDDDASTGKSTSARSVATTVSDHPPFEGGSSPSTRAWGFAAGGAGLVSYGVAIALLARAHALDLQSERDAAEAKKVSPPDPVHKAAAYEHHDAAVASQSWGLAAMGVGTLAMGVSAYLLLKARDAPRASVATIIEVHPHLGLGRAGLDVDVRF
jgi:hypothetical protein